MVQFSIEAAASRPPTNVMTAASTPTYKALLEQVGPRSIGGYCYDPDRLWARIVVELQIDGIAVAWSQADGLVESLAQAGIGDGCYGFAFHVTPEVLQGGCRAQLFVANVDHAPAPPIALDPLHLDGPRDAGAGRVRWLGGRQVAGWLAHGAGSAPKVRISLDGQLIAQAVADRWHHVQEVGGARAVPSFNLHLPEAIADGTLKRIVVTDGEGRALGGSPLNLVAFPDPLVALVEAQYGSEHGPTRRRAELFDTLLPRSWPLDEPNDWLSRHRLPSPPAPPALAIVMVGAEADAIERTLTSLDAQPGLSWTAAALPSADRIGFEPNDLTAFLDAECRDCTAILAVPAGAEFRPNAALRLAAALADAPSAHLAYGDICIGDARRGTPLGFPSFDYERWLEQGYGALAFAVPIALARVAARSGADTLYRLAAVAFDRLDEQTGSVVHVPGIAAHIPSLNLDAAARHLVEATRHHLAARGITAHLRVGSGSVLPAVQVSRAPPVGSLSVVIPTRDRADLLRRCLASIAPALDRHRAQLVVVDNGSSDPDTHALFATIRAQGGRVLEEPGPFNYARLSNRAVAAVDSEFVLFLNNDVEMRSEGWLDELLGRLSEPTTGAVGAVLRWPNGVIQHGGIVLGPGFSAAHAFDDRFHGDAGYGDLLRVANEPSAVTGACLLVRRHVYEAVGGMDEHRFPVNFNDVDLCLKLLQRGWRVVLTPHLEAIHLGSASRGDDRRPEQRRRYHRELAALRARWGATLLMDPAYSPLLAMSDDPYTALACEPLALSPRRRQVTTDDPSSIGR